MWSLCETTSGTYSYLMHTVGSIVGGYMFASVTEAVWANSPRFSV